MSLFSNARAVVAVATLAFPSVSSADTSATLPAPPDANTADASAMVPNLFFPDSVAQALSEKHHKPISLERVRQVQLQAARDLRKLADDGILSHGDSEVVLAYINRQPVEAEKLRSALDGIGGTARALNIELLRTCSAKIAQRQLGLVCCGLTTLVSSLGTLGFLFLANRTRDLESQKLNSIFQKGWKSAAAAAILAASAIVALSLKELPSVDVTPLHNVQKALEAAEIDDGLIKTSI